MDNIDVDSIKELMWDDNENDEAIVNFGNFEDPKEDDDFIQSVLDSFIIKEKKRK